MFSRKVAALAIMAIIVVVASQPAVAGVGGCKIPGVGGCGPGGGQLSTYTPETRTPSILDTLNGAVPADVLAALRAMFEFRSGSGVIEQPSDLTTQGVGGCFFGVGGCKL